MSTELLTYIGTYTRSMPFVEAKSEGVYIYRLNVMTGQLTHQSTVPGLQNPSFLALSPSRKFLYSVNEIDDKDGQKSGGVTAFARDLETGELTYLNDQISGGAAPCHLIVDSTEKFVLAANYTGGSVCVMPIQPDGSLGEMCEFIQHEGASMVNPQRQEKAHAHSINLDNSNRFAYVPDLGLDKVMIYNFDNATGKLKPNMQPFIDMAPGAGPRHFDFHPNGKVAYVINELGNTITACSFDSETGNLSELHSVPTLPSGFDDENTTADIHVHPSGKFVYGSNRGHNSIASFKVDQKTGKLTAIGHTSTQGETPRNFGIDPSGQILLAANQDTSSIATYFIDQTSGTLAPTGFVTNVPTPVCIKMLEA